MFPSTRNASRTRDAKARWLVNGVVPALFVAALFVAAPPASAAAPQEPTVVLIRAALAGEPLPEDGVAGALVAASPEARGALLELLSELDSSRSARRADARTESLLSLRQQVRRIPRRFADGLLEVDGKNLNAGRIIDVGLEVVTALGAADDVGAAIDLAGPWPRKGPPRIEAKEDVLRRALTAILARRPDAHRSIGRELASAPSELHVAIIDALGEGTDRGTASSLVGCLGMFRELDGPILNRMQGVLRRTKPELHRTELNAISRHLEREAPFVRSQAALVLGQLDDVEAVAPLLPLLTDSEPNVVAAAHWSLCELTAMTMGPDPMRWRAWYEEQDEVWRERSAELFGALESQDRAEIVAALNQVSLLRLHRVSIGPELIALARSTDDHVVLLHVCAAFETLRAPGVEATLVELLRHRHAEVVDRAHRTLSVLTGLELPADAERWSKVLSLVP